MHTFANFRRDEDHNNFSVRDALRESVNLAFIRIMRDVVRYYMYQPGSTARELPEGDDAERTVYLSRFADREGRVFLRRFYRKYHGKTADELLATLVAGVRPTAERLAVIFRAVKPQADAHALAAFIDEYRDCELTDRELDALYERHAPGKFSLADQGYLARIHPLELWLVGYLRQHPDANWTQVVEASAQERQAVYKWLFTTRHRGAQNSAHLHPARTRGLRGSASPVEASGLSLRSAGAVAGHIHRQFRRPPGSAGRTDGHHRKRRRATAHGAARSFPFCRRHAL